MQKKALVWVIFALGFILIGALLYWVSTLLLSIEGSTLKSIIGVLGIAFIGYSWLNGKGVNQVATEAGLALSRKAKRLENSVNDPDVPRSSKQTDPSGSKLPPMRERAVFLYRKPRMLGDIKQGGTSWLGGLPALGGMDWPRDEAGALMHHVMQVDLSDAGTFLSVPGLPTTGSLAVFVRLGKNTRFETKVLYIAHPGPETTPPEQLVPIGDHTTGGMLVRGGDPERLGTLPRWTVDLVRLDVVPEDEEDVRDSLSAIAPLGTGMNISTDSFADHLPNGRDPSYWHSAQLFARSLDKAIRDKAGLKLFLSMAERSEKTLAGYRLDGFPKNYGGKSAADIERDLQADIDRNREFADRARALQPKMGIAAAGVMEWAFARDPWDVMTNDDLDMFKKYFEPFKYGDYGSDGYLAYQCSSNSYGFLHMIADETLKEMVRGPDKVFRLLPDVVQKAADNEHHTPGLPHQMFGPPTWIQEAAADHEEDHLLFQIVHDDLIGLRLGDVGHIQVWISPDDLAAGNWGAITATFECS